MGLYDDDDDIFLMADFKTFLREYNQRNSENEMKWKISGEKARM